MNRRSLLASLSLFLVASCSEPEGEHAMESSVKPSQPLLKVISGSVTYRERMALPPGSVVTVVLEDQSRMDAPATLITDYTHITDGPPPYSFRLVYDPEKIDDRMRYGVRARIENDGQLMFTSTTHIDPFTGAEGKPLEIVVSRAGN